MSLKVFYSYLFYLFFMLNFYKVALAMEGDLNDVVLCSYLLSSDKTSHVHQKNIEIDLGLDPQQIRKYAENKLRYEHGDDLIVSSLVFELARSWALEMITKAIKE